MQLPLVAIVGRPNVGKSMLFNRLVGQRLSIVEDTPGVTRDRLYSECEWNGRVFNLVDTGGIEPHTGDEMLLFMRAQAEIAIETADVIILVTDIRTGLTAADKEVADLLLRSKKPLVLAVNKCDSPGSPPPDIYEFYNLGLGEPFPVSAFHGLGTGDLLDRCMKYIEREYDGGEEDGGAINVAVIGKPNAGKSSLINYILGEKRVIVSDIPGTTRDAIDTAFENKHGKYNFIDTAGLRKKARVDESIERYSVLRTSMAIERSDVCLILIDAQDGVTEQDTKVAGLAHEAGKASVLIVNKWDTVEKETKTLENMEKQIRHDLVYMDYAPILFISALTGQRVNKLFELINTVYEASNRRITTGMLNSVLADATARMQPPSKKGKRLKIYYMTQTGICPPNIVAFVNDEELFHFSYRRYLENRIRDAYGFEGTPIRIIVKQRGEQGGK
ncbi:MAG: ribosome biogenesis GTPase Der [Oscillospiraceae bacterium]|jgi:GTP-binding protein|nr:ribosome biogenesis GTPase Der [Oscillospiraceae bacterium]